MVDAALESGYLGWEGGVCKGRQGGAQCGCTVGSEEWELLLLDLPEDG